MVDMNRACSRAAARCNEPAVEPRLADAEFWLDEPAPAINTATPGGRCGRTGFEHRIDRFGSLLLRHGGSCYNRVSTSTTGEA